MFRNERTKNESENPAFDEVKVHHGYIQQSTDNDHNMELKTKIGPGDRKEVSNIRICRNCGVVFDLERRKDKDCPLCHNGEHLAFGSDALTRM
ncbi:MAG: hypothetical protein WCC17_07430 [Candidatus Nitrosopolaris sp.]